VFDLGAHVFFLKEKGSALSPDFYIHELLSPLKTRRAILEGG
jgi:hypothetical protein